MELSCLLSIVECVIPMKIAIFQMLNLRLSLFIYLKHQPTFDLINQLGEHEQPNKEERQKENRRIESQTHTHIFACNVITKEWERVIHIIILPFAGMNLSYDSKHLMDFYFNYSHSIYIVDSLLLIEFERNKERRQT